MEQIFLFELQNSDKLIGFSDSFEICRLGLKLGGLI